VDEKPVKPLHFALLQNYPNPFNPTTTIDYEIPKQERVTLEIYDVLGQKIKTLVDGVLQPGDYSAMWRGTNDAGIFVATGVYFYRLEAGNYTSVKKMLLLK
jgi:flagellar hook assembly protein FlgD